MNTSVKSSVVAAQIVTSEMRTASNALHEISNQKIDDAEDTTLAVEEQASGANKQIISLSENFVQAFEKDIARIMLSAEKFDELDKQMYRGGVR